MRHVAISFLSLFLSLAAQAQSTQPCLVTQYNQNEKKTPLPGVEVMVSNAGSSVSDQAGRLTLSFRTLKPGDKVNLISAKKAGYEVFNSEAVQQWFVSRDQSHFMLVLVKKEYFEQLKAALTQTSSDSYKRKYEQAVKELEKQKKDGALKEEEFNRRYDELENQYQTQISNLDNYIDQFARIDLSEVSAEEQRILKMVEQGLIDEAVVAYEALDISGKLLQARENKKTLAEAKARIEEEEAGQDAAIKELIAKQDREIATLKLAGGKENYDKIGRMLKENALADTTDYGAILDYAYFAYGQKDYPEAERFFLLALEISTDLSIISPGRYLDMVAIQNNLGNLYDITHDFAKSKDYLSMALDGYAQLFSLNPDAYRADLALAQNNLGLHYERMGDYSQAEECLLEALNNYSQSCQQDPDAHRAGLAMVQHNLGNFYYSRQDYKKAEDYLLKALDNKTQLFVQDPDNYRIDLAMTQNNLGSLYSATGDNAKSEEYSMEALGNYSRLFDLNPDAYRADLAMTQNNLGSFYQSMGIYPKSEDFYLKALENITQSYRQYPDAYCADLAKVQSNLGFLYLKTGDFAKAEDFYVKALENYSHSYRKNPDTSLVDWARALDQLGFIYNITDDFEKSEVYQKKALECYERLYDQDPDAYRADLAMALGHLGLTFNLLGDYVKAEEYYLRAIEVYQVLFGIAPDIYRENLFDLQYSVMNLLANDDSRLDRYDAMLDAAWSNYEELIKGNGGNLAITADLRLRKGWSLLLKGQNDEAVALLESTYALDRENTAPYLAQAYNAKAYDFVKVGDFAQAMMFTESALALVPDNASFYDTKGEILLMQGEEEGALEMWKKVMELDPGFLEKWEDTELHRGLKERKLIVE